MLSYDGMSDREKILRIYKKVIDSHELSGEILKDFNRDWQKMEEDYYSGSLINVFSVIDEILDDYGLSKLIFESNNKIRGENKMSKKYVKETGEWDDNDEEMYMWKEALKDVLLEIQIATNGKLKLIDVRGFDAYQGPYGIVEINGRRYNVWTMEDALWIEDYPVDNSSASGFRPGLYGETEQIINIINNDIIVSNESRRNRKTRKESKIDVGSYITAFNGKVGGRVISIGDNADNFRVKIVDSDVNGINKGDIVIWNKNDIFSVFSESRKVRGIYRKENKLSELNNDKLIDLYKSLIISIDNGNADIPGDLDYSSDIADELYSRGIDALKIADSVTESRKNRKTRKESKIDMDIVRDVYDNFIEITGVQRINMMDHEGFMKGDMVEATFSSIQKYVLDKYGIDIQKNQDYLDAIDDLFMHNNFESRKVRGRYRKESKNVNSINERIRLCENYIKIYFSEDAQKYWAEYKKYLEDFKAGKVDEKQVVHDARFNEEKAKSGAAGWLQREFMMNITGSRFNESRKSRGRYRKERLIQDPEAKQIIDTIAGPAKYIGTEVENQYGKWNNNYYTSMGFYVLHRGNKHDVYQVQSFESRKVRGRYRKEEKQTIEVDYAADINDLQATLNRFNIVGHVVDPHSPGGGWPVVQLTGEKENLIEFLEYGGYDIDAQFESRKIKESDNGFNQLCVWEGTVLEPDQVSEFIDWIKTEFGADAKFDSTQITKPGKGGPGGRKDVFFYIADKDIGKFSIPRLQYGIRWWEDVLDNGGGILYSDEFLASHPKKW